MQVRIANKQDEAEIRTFVESICKASGSDFNLETSDSDLRNVEASYFGKEGLFIVAEQEGKIVGVAGARKLTENELELKRLIMSDQFADDEVVSEMLGVIINFARRLLYSKIEIASPGEEFKRLFEKNGFKKQEQSEGLSLSVAFDY